VADTRNYVQGQDYFLSGSGITLSATSAVLTSMEYPDGTLIVMADFGTLGYITFEPETEKEENASFTGITQNANGTATITGLTRGLAFKTPYTADLALRQSHSGGSLARISNSAPFYNELTNKNNDETINNAWTFPSTEAARPQNGADTDTAILAALVTFGQLSRTSFAGVSDASTVSKGIVEIATQTEVNEGDDSGSTTAPVVVIPSTLLQTRDSVITTDFTYGATLTALAPVYVDTAASNKLKLALATAAATADTFVGITVDSGVDTDVNKRVQIAGIVTGLSGLTPGAVVFLTDAGGISSVAGTYRFPLGVAISATAMEMFPAPARRPLDLAGANSSATVSNFNESMTFFNATDITGAEAETLSAGSTTNADTLHTHAIIPGYSEIIHGNLPSTTLGRFQFAMNSAGTYGYIARRWSSGADENLDIYRYVLDPLTKTFIYDGTTVNLADGTYSFSGFADIGLVATDSYVYAMAIGASNLVLVRMLPDLTSATLFTTSGANPGAGTILSACGNDTTLYLKSTTATLLLEYALSGTTATRGTDITLTSGVAGVTGFDGTNLFNYDPVTGNIRKYSTAGGAAVSTTLRQFARENNDFNANPLEITSNGAIGLLSTGPFLIGVGAAWVNETTTDSLFLRFYKISKP